MNFTEGLRIAIDSIIANPLRSFLTLLGIVMGVTAIIAVVAIINGLNIYVEERIIRLGPSSFEINRFGIITNREQFLKAIRRNPPLRMSDARAIRDRAVYADRVAVKSGTEADVRYGRRTLRSVWLRGITPEILDIEPYEIVNGRGISGEDNDRAAMVAFLGADLADEFFGSIDPIGKSIKVLGRSFEVVGVAGRRGSVWGQSRDTYVTIPIATFQKILGQRESVSIVVRAANPALVEEAMDEARVILRARHHLKFTDPDDFGLMSLEGMNALWRDMTSAIFNVALFVVGISLVVGGIVIMNIMLVSVIERTAEIGVRKAAGARHRDIRRQFLAESAVLAGIGGLIGLLFSYGATVAIRNLSPFPAAFPWWAPVLALSISSVVGITFGIYPATKAARLNPIDALRSK